MTARLRLYRELAHWWPLMSPPSHYTEEAAHLLPLLAPDPATRLTLLELGSGGGSLASHLAGHFTLTLTDLSPDMLAVSRQVNPAAEHLAGDMRTLELGRTFDRVLIHDAIMYALTEADLAATLATARRHCRAGGRVVVLPDFVRETFNPMTGSGGEDADDGRGLRYLEWVWDPDPADTTAEVAFAIMLRQPDGSVAVELDHQRFGVFPRTTWLRLFAAAGFAVETVVDPWRADVFVGRLSP